VLFIGCFAARYFHVAIEDGFGFQQAWAAAKTPLSMPRTVSRVMLIIFVPFASVSI
jgi:hypothetical protein